MKIGLSFFPVRAKVIVPVATRADELGYESVWTGEHIVFPAAVETPYPYDPSAGAPLPTTPLLDPLLTFAHLAACTHRIRFGTGILVLPVRQPLVVAKNATTLDVLSGGRFLLGIGSGWLREEFEALEMPWDHRGARMEEMVEIMHKLWAHERVSHEGRYYRFPELGFEPKPVNGRVPILIGGETPIALRRAARVGDGWFGMHHTPASAAARVKELAGLRESEEALEITVAVSSLPDADTLRRMRDAGVHRVVFTNKLLSGDTRSLDATLDGLERFADETMRPVASEG